MKRSKKGNRAGLPGTSITLREFVTRLVAEHAKHRSKEYAGDVPGFSVKSRIEEVLRGLKRSRPEMWQVERMAGWTVGRITDGRYGNPDRRVAYPRDPPAWFKEGARLVGLDEGLRLMSKDVLVKEMAREEAEELLERVSRDEYLTGDLREFKRTDLARLRRNYRRQAAVAGMDKTKLDRLVAKVRPTNVKTLFGHACSSVEDDLHNAESSLLRDDLEEAKKWLGYARGGGMEWVRLQGRACSQEPPPGLEVRVRRLQEAISKSKLVYVVKAEDYSVGSLTEERLLLLGNDKVVEATKTEGARSEALVFRNEGEAKAKLSEMTWLLRLRGVRGRPYVRRYLVFPDELRQEFIARVNLVRKRRGTQPFKDRILRRQDLEAVTVKSPTKVALVDNDFEGTAFL